MKLSDAATIAVAISAITGINMGVVVFDLIRSMGWFGLWIFCFFCFGLTREGTSAKKAPRKRKSPSSTIYVLQKTHHHDCCKHEETTTDIWTYESYGSACEQACRGQMDEIMAYHEERSQSW